MFILLTNDDGIDSEGLLYLKRALDEIGEVAVIAPNRNWSLAGHARTIERPLRVISVILADGSRVFATAGTPADAASLGILGFFGRKPDLVVAGINKGPNLGEDVLYSGTVAAAVEGVINGIPSLAVSLADYYQWDFTYAAEFTAKLVRERTKKGLSDGILLNVNLPNVPQNQIAGVAITRLGKRIYRDRLLERQDPFGRTYYWIGGEIPTGVAEEGTDYKAILENKVSITPIHLDLTAHKFIEKLRRWNLSP